MFPDLDRVNSKPTNAESDHVTHCCKIVAAHDLSRNLPDREDAAAKLAANENCGGIVGFVSISGVHKKP